MHESPTGWSVIDRRTFIVGAGVFLSGVPVSGAAQADRVRRIGFIGNGSPTAAAMTSLEALRRSLRELGWTEGRNLEVEARWGEGKPERLPSLVADLVRSSVDVIVVGGPPAILAAQKAAGTIPVVFVSLIDPVTMGFVQSLARPGGTMTGIASHYEELIPKQLQLLKEAVPGLSRVALLRRPESAPPLLAAAQAAAQNLGLTVRTLQFVTVADLDDALKIAHDDRVGAIHVLPSPFLVGALRARMIQLATRYRLPSCYEFRSYVQDGGLMSYGPDINEMFARAGNHVDRILKGSKPGDLPVERPAKFELVINLATAKSIGLTIPPTLLRRADALLA